MKTTTLLLALFFSTSLIAQNSKVTFFTDNGERFFVILNGLRYNEQAQTNVPVDNLVPQAYKAKIIFEDETLGEVNKTLYLEPATAYTVNIKKKQEGSISKFSKQAANEVKNELDSDTMQQQYYADKEDWYVMRLVSQVPIAQAAPVAPAPPPAQNRATAYPPAPASQTVTTTTTTTTATAPAPATGVSMNISITDNGMGTGVSMSATDGYYQESSSTTVTTTTSGGAPAPAAPDHYVMPGYNGPYGCPWPMTPQDFAAAKNTISSKTWDETRLSIAKQVTQSNCLFADQVKEVVMLMEWEETKLDFAKFAYRYTYDQANYFKVHDAFEWESSIEDLNRSIGH